MKTIAVLVMVTVGIVGLSAAAGSVRANDIATKTTTVHAKSMAENAQMHDTLAKLSSISAEDLQAMQKEFGDLVIFDSRPPHEYAAGHIPTAVELTADEATPERLHAFAPKKDTPMVFYCGGKECPASGKTAYKAAMAGYTHIYKYEGGITDWQAKGYKIVKD